MGKKRTFYLLSCMLLALTITILFTGTVEAKTKKMKTEKYQTVYVACGETYQISRIAKEKKGADTGLTLAEDIKGKKVKWSSSSKKLVITNKTIRVKKPGNYRLIGKTKKRKFVLPVSATNKNYSKDYSQVSFAVIVSGNTGGRVKVENAEEVRAICEKIRQSKYTFDYEGSQNRYLGWTYAIHLYTADNVLIDSICTGATYEGNFYFVCKNPDILKGYVDQLYNKYPQMTLQP